MKATLLVFLCPAILCSEVKPKLIFEDDFERNESREDQEEIGKGWGSNSKRRANGNKQVDLKDGAMHITFHPSADHAVSVTHSAKFRNGMVTLRFMLPNKEDSLGLNFADLDFKEVHAGHLCVTRIKTTGVTISDLKTGSMNRQIREQRLAKSLSPEQLKLLKTKTATFPNKLEPGKWHKLVVSINGETMSVIINGKKVGELKSAGIGHPTKKTLRLSVPKKAVVDDVRIYSL